MTGFLRVLFAVSALMGATLVESSAKVTVSEKTKHYSVDGRTGKEIYAQIGRRGPRLSGSKEHKVATATLDFDVRNIRAGLRGNRCVITGVDVHVDVLYRMPKWTGKGSPAVRKAWQNFEDHLWRHEKRHKDIGLDYARRLEKGILALTGDARRECAGMKEAAERHMKSARAWHGRKQDAFDGSWFGDGGQQFKYDRALKAAN